MGQVIIKDNTRMAIAAMKAAKARALEIVGGMAESYTKGLTPVKTGALRNSFTHQVDGDKVTVGTNTSYAPFVELGTGKLYSPPPQWIEAQAKRGRGLDRWFYQDAKGQWHVGYPRRGVHMLQHGVGDHLDQYKAVIRNELHRG